MKIFCYFSIASELRLIASQVIGKFHFWWSKLKSAINLFTCRRWQVSPKLWQTFRFIFFHIQLLCKIFRPKYTYTRKRQRERERTHFCFGQWTIVRLICNEFEFVLVFVTNITTVYGYGRLDFNAKSSCYSIMNSTSSMCGLWLLLSLNAVR